MADVVFHPKPPEYASFDLLICRQSIVDEEWKKAASVSPRCETRIAWTFVETERCGLHLFYLLLIMYF